MLCNDMHMEKELKLQAFTCYDKNISWNNSLEYRYITG